MKDTSTDRPRRSKQTTTTAPSFRHVLVPTDLTGRTVNALELAARLADADSARITLVHVIETIDGLAFEELKRFYKRLERSARAAMTALARRAQQHVASAVVYGRRGEEIVKFATAHDVDLIVLASHRINASSANRDWGTISHKVGILAQCPVLLVK